MASEHLVDYLAESMMEPALLHPKSFEVLPTSSELDGLCKPAIKAVGETNYYTL
jgi:hypothetical protein